MGEGLPLPKQAHAQPKRRLPQSPRPVAILKGLLSNTSNQFIYSSSLAEVDPEQVRQLWAKTLGVDRDAKRIMEAMRHSFAIVVVKERRIADAASSEGKIVGVGRAVSDGAFIATICDVAVDPAFQRRGIGRRIVKYLVEDMRGRGPSGYAVFPPPRARHFFWMVGFRSDRKYKIMAYRGWLLDVRRDPCFARVDGAEAVTQEAAQPRRTGGSVFDESLYAPDSEEGAYMGNTEILEDD